MPSTRVVFYRTDDGSVPLLDWFDRMPAEAVGKCRVRIERLKELGHEIRRPEAAYLRDGIYELRVGLRSVNYRMLYFFHENIAIVLSHGLTKERVVAPTEIRRAVEFKKRFQADPKRHTYEEL